MSEVDRFLDDLYGTSGAEVAPDVDLVKTAAALVLEAADGVEEETVAAEDTTGMEKEAEYTAEDMAEIAAYFDEDPDGLAAVSDRG